MDTNPNIDRQTIADGFSSAMKGALDQDKIDSAVSAITGATTVYPATAAFSIFKTQVEITGGETFTGRAGVGGSGGTSDGDVYTSDINLLYSDTVNFQYMMTPVYTSVIFFDKNGGVPGSFQAGAVSIVTGVGGGSGSWS